MRKGVGEGVGARRAAVLQCVPRVRAVARPQGPLAHQILRGGLEVVGPADLLEELDEVAGQVEVLAELGGPVVPGEGVVEVVPALAEGDEGHEPALAGHDVAVGKEKFKEGQASRARRGDKHRRGFDALQRTAAPIRRVLSARGAGRFLPDFTTSDFTLSCCT